MKKILTIFLVLTGLFLGGCSGSSSIEKTLTADGGTWEGKGFGVSTTFTFYDDGDFSITEAGSTYAGTYKYSEKENKLTLDVSNSGKNIFSNLKEENGTITATFGKNTVTFEKNK